MSKTATDDYQTYLRGNNSAMHARIQDLEGTLRLVTSQSNKAMRERDTLKTKLNEQARDTLVVLDERDKLRKQVKWFEDNIDNRVLEAFNEGMFTAKGELVTLRRQLSEANEKLADPEEFYQCNRLNLEAVCKERDELRAERNELLMLVESLEYNATAYRRQRADTTEHLKEVLEQRDELRLTVRGLDWDLRAVQGRLAEQEQLLQTYETQLTLQDEGPAQLLERCERQKRDLDYYAKQLSDAKIQEKEHHLMLHELRMEVDEANEKLADEMNRTDKYVQRILELQLGALQTPSAPTINGNQHTPNSDFTADDLRARVKELQAPTIMKQTFAPIYPYLIDSPLPPQPSRELALNWGPGDALGVLRFDHMSDGTVTKTLEPTTGENNAK